MRSLPRVAFGAVDHQIDHRPILWGLLHRLEQAGIQSQCLFSQSRFATDGAASITGRAYRHLDAKLMTADVCREVLLHGAQGADVAIVEDGDVSTPESIEQLSRWLGLPRVVVVDAGHEDACRMPNRPDHVDGVFLSGIRDHDQFVQQRLRWEALWGAPVLGGLVGCAHVCAILERLPTGSRPSPELVHALGENLVLVKDAESMLSLGSDDDWLSMPRRIFKASDAMRDVKVAVAFDDAFHRYFTDTLDLLELNGAVLRDFSPLADADLPAGTDVVYLGCGHVERFAAALAANPCMIAALRRHGSGGGRIYAEGGAAGYLCDKIELETGESIPMCGILPAVARHRSHGATPTLVDVSLSEQCWLGAKGYHLRGYRNRHWRMESISPHWSIANRIATERPTLDSDLLCRDNVIASQVHLNLVAQPHLLSSFAPATAIAPV